MAWMWVYVPIARKHKQQVLLVPIFNKLGVSEEGLRPSVAILDVLYTAANQLYSDDAMICLHSEEEFANSSKCLKEKKGAHVQLVMK